MSENQHVFHGSSQNPSSVIHRDQVESLPKEQVKGVLSRLKMVFRRAQKAGDHDGMGWPLLQMAMVLRGQRQDESAIKLLEEARTLFSSSSNDEGLGCVYEELSLCHRGREHYSIALDYAHKAIDLLLKSRRMLDVAWTYDNLSVIYSHRSQRLESLTYARRARGIFLEYQSAHGLAWNACHLGALYADAGFFRRSKHFYKEALSLFTSLGSKQGMAYSLLGLSVIHRNTAEFLSAENAILKAQCLFEALDMKDQVGWCLLNMAAIKRLEGKDEEAVVLNRRAIQILGPLHNNDGVAWGLFQTSQILRERGQLVKAWQTLRDAMGLHVDIANRPGIGWVECEYGRTYEELDDTVHARESLLKAQKIASQLQMTSLQVEVDKTMAQVAMDEGAMQKGKAFLQKAEAACDRLQNQDVHADVLLSMARFHTLLADTANAHALLESVEAMITAHGLEHLKLMAGIIRSDIHVLKGEKTKATELLSDIALRAGSGHKRQRAEALIGLSQLLRAEKSPMELSLMLFHAEKEIRLIGSKRLRAKLLLARSVVQLQETKTLNERGVFQALTILHDARLFALEKHALESLKKLAAMNGLVADVEKFEAALDDLTENSVTDLHALSPSYEWASLLPVPLSF